MAKNPYPQIDKLRAKFDADKTLSLREACWILWAELGICSTQYYMFAYWVKKQGFTVKTKLGWKLWKAMFEEFVREDYPKMRDDFDLIASVKKQSMDKLFGKL